MSIGPSSHPPSNLTRLPFDITRVEKQGDCSITLHNTTLTKIDSLFSTRADVKEVQSKPKEAYSTITFTNKDARNRAFEQLNRTIEWNSRSPATPIPLSDGVGVAYIVLQSACTQGPDWLKDPKNQTCIEIAKTYLVSSDTILDLEERDKLRDLSNRISTLNPEELKELHDLFVVHDFMCPNKWNLHNFSLKIEELERKYFPQKITQPLTPEQKGLACVTILLHKVKEQGEVWATDSNNQALVNTAKKYLESLEFASNLTIQPLITQIPHLDASGWEILGKLHQRNLRKDGINKEDLDRIVAQVAEHYYPADYTENVMPIANPEIQPRAMFSTTTIAVVSQKQAQDLVNLVGPSLATSTQAPLLLESFDKKSAKIKCANSTALKTYSELIKTSLTATEPTPLGDFVIQIPNKNKDSIITRIKNSFAPNQHPPFQAGETTIGANNQTSTFILCNSSEDRDLVLQKLLSPEPVAALSTPASLEEPAPTPLSEEVLTTDQNADSATPIQPLTPTSLNQQPPLKELHEGICAAWMTITLARKDKEWLKQDRNQVLIKAAKDYLANERNIFTGGDTTRLEHLKTATSSEEKEEKALLEEKQKAAKALAEYAKRLPPKDRWLSQDLMRSELDTMNNLLCVFDLGTEDGLASPPKKKIAPKWNREGAEWDAAIKKYTNQFTQLQGHKQGADIRL